MGHDGESTQWARTASFKFIPVIKSKEHKNSEENFKKEARKMATFIQI